MSWTLSLFASLYYTSFFGCVPLPKPNLLRSVISFSQDTSSSAVVYSKFGSLLQPREMGRLQQRTNPSCQAAGNFLWPSHSLVSSSCLFVLTCSTQDILFNICQLDHYILKLCANGLAKRKVLLVLSERTMVLCVHMSLSALPGSKTQEHEYPTAFLVYPPLIIWGPLCTGSPNCQYSDPRRCSTSNKASNPS